jgi:hypothetical protein
MSDGNSRMPLPEKRGLSETGFSRAWTVWTKECGTPCVNCITKMPTSLEVFLIEQTATG